jgi:hypothetical protein
LNSSKVWRVGAVAGVVSDVNEQCVEKCVEKFGELLFVFAIFRQLAIASFE